MWCGVVLSSGVVWLTVRSEVCCVMMWYDVVFWSVLCSGVLRCGVM